MIPEGGCHCSNEAVLVATNQDSFSIRVAAESTFVDKLVLSPGPICIMVVRFTCSYLNYSDYLWRIISGTEMDFSGFLGRSRPEVTLRIPL